MKYISIQEAAFTLDSKALSMIARDAFRKAVEHGTLEDMIEAHKAYAVFCK